MEAIKLSSTGYIQVHAYASNAQIPLKDVAVTITDTGGSAIAMRLTDRSGKLAQPVAIAVPDLSAGQSADTGVIPFATVDLYAKLKDYEEILIRSLQVFPQTVTVQDLELIPLAEFPEDWVRSETFTIPPQNL